MFEINKEELEQNQAEQMAKKMFVRMMSQAILESEEAPEHMKLSVRIMEKWEDLHETIHELVVRYINPTEGRQANVETLKKVLEYFELVEVGIKQFAETTPFVALNEEEETC